MHISIKRVITLLAAVFAFCPLCSAQCLAAPGEKLVALTFDDGPDRYSGALLDTLAEKDVKASFCIYGMKVDYYRDALVRMAREGHQILNHTYNHPMLTRLSDAQALEEIERNRVLLAQITGQASFWLRPPYGLINNSTLSQLNVPVIHWSLDTEDWSHHSAAHLRASILNNVRDGDIILMHETEPTTVEAIGGIIDALRAEGYALVTVEELFRCRGITPQSGTLYHDVPIAAATAYAPWAPIFCKCTDCVQPLSFTL